MHAFMQTVHESTKSSRWVENMMWKVSPRWHVGCVLFRETFRGAVQIPLGSNHKKTTIRAKQLENEPSIFKKS